MSDLLALGIKPYERDDISGIFFPVAFSGKVDALVPNNGLLIMGDQRKATSFRSLGEVGVVPLTEEEGKLFLSPLNIVIASTRGEVLEKLFPALVPLTLDEAEGLESFIAPGRGFFVLQKMIVEPITIARDSIIKLINVEGVQEYSERHQTYEMEWDEKRILVVVTDPPSMNLNADLFDLNDEYFVPTPQRVKPILITNEEGVNASAITKVVFATDNPQEFQQLFAGAELDPIFGKRAEKICREQRIQIGTPLFLVENIQCKGGFYTSSKFKKDVDQDRKRAMNDFLDQL